MQYTQLIFIILNAIYVIILTRWNRDPLCKGPFPIEFTKIAKTLSNWKKEKYETSPQSCDDIKKAFENPATLADLGTSLHKDHGLIFNHVHQQKEFSYCVLSSPKSIQIMNDELEPNERFFLIDGTFRITPMCKVFKQVLVIHGQFGLKVSLQYYVCMYSYLCQIHFIFFFAQNVMHFKEFSVGCCANVK